ncbi:MAG: hypothetical protein OXU94_00045 [Gammaproteobacteria bacterium]|nr:hypothetical protein [Gammaproteobacteria bacterium]
MQKLPPELIRARTCYKHPAGELGIAITRAVLRRGCIEDATVKQRHGFALTARGRKWCARYGVDAHLPATSNGGGAGKDAGRPFSVSCMDHSHRAPHLAGVFGRAMLSFMRARGYCRAGAGDRRLSVTPQGTAFLRAALGIDWGGVQHDG